jgi:hypothetical protein
MKKDIYTVFIFKSGERFYFKNNELHREAGFAIVSTLSSSKDNNAVDEHLYDKVLARNSTGNYFTFKFADGSQTRLKSPVRYMYASAYYLDDKIYSEQEFKIAKLQDELQEQLPTNETAIKKLKL